MNDENTVLSNIFPEKMYLNVLKYETVKYKTCKIYFGENLLIKFSQITSGFKENCQDMGICQEKGHRPYES